MDYHIFLSQVDLKTILLRHFLRFGMSTSILFAIESVTRNFPIWTCPHEFFGNVVLWMSLCPYIISFTPFQCIHINGIPYTYQTVAIMSIDRHFWYLAYDQAFLQLCLPSGIYPNVIMSTVLFWLVRFRTYSQWPVTLWFTAFLGVIMLCL